VYVSSQLLLKLNINKCKCVDFGKMAKSAMSGDCLQIDNGVMMCCDTFEYLSIYFRCGKRLQVEIYPIKRHFYAASNSIFMNVSHQDQLIQLHLQESYCLSLLTYCHGAINLSKSQLSDLNVCWNNLGLYRNLFHFHRWESVRVFINGIGKLDFLHLSKLVTAKFFNI